MARSLQHVAAILITTAVWVANAGYSLSPRIAKSTPSLAASAFHAGSVRTFLEDSWVDTQISAPTPSPCQSLDKCGWNTTDWNRSIFAYADIIGSKQLLLAGHEDALSEHETKREASVQVEAARRQAIELSAVQVSVLLSRSCTEFGPRQCWRRSIRSPVTVEGTRSASRELRPVTIRFGDSDVSRDVRGTPASASAPLVTSLKHFHLSSA